MRCRTALAFAASLALATPAFAQAERAATCVQGAMASLLTLGAVPEQLAPVALARCYDEIEALLTNVKVEAARVALRRELYDFAVHVAGVTLPADSTSVTLDVNPSF